MNYDAILGQWTYFHINPFSMKNLLTTFLLLLVIHLNGQYVSEETDTLTHRKNQIGAVINPVAAFMLGTSTSQLHYGIQYKRLLGESKRLRFGLLYQNLLPDLNDLGVPIASNDSSVLFLSEQSEYRYGEFRAGIEWSNFKTKHDAVYGLDLLLGYDITRDEQHYKLVNYAMGEEGNSSQTAVDRDSMFSFFEQHALVIGISPTIGYRVTIKQKWELLAYASPEVVYFAPMSSSGKKEPGNEYYANSVLFRMRLLDLVISYSF